MSISLNNILPYLLLSNAQSSTQAANAQSTDSNKVASGFASLLAYLLQNSANTQLSNGLLSSGTESDSTGSSAYNSLNGISSSPLSSSSSDDLLWNLLSQSVSPLSTATSTDGSSASDSLTDSQNVYNLNQQNSQASIL